MPPAPRDICQCLETFWGVTIAEVRGRYSSISCIETSDAEKYPKMHRRPPKTTYPAQNIDRD